MTAADTDPTPTLAEFRRMNAAEVNAFFESRGLRSRVVSGLPVTDSPTTEAGRRLLDHFGPMPLPDAQELHRRSAMGRRVKLEAAILAIEAEAREQGRREQHERDLSEGRSNRNG